MNRDQRMDELLRQKLADHKVDPSPGVWEGITGRLPGASAAAWKLWLNTLIIPVSILILAGGIYLDPFAESGEAEGMRNLPEAAPVAENTPREAVPETTRPELEAIPETENTNQDLPADPVASRIPAENKAEARKPITEPQAVQNTPTPSQLNAPAKEVIPQAIINEPASANDDEQLSIASSSEELKETKKISRKVNKKNDDLAELIPEQPASNPKSEETIATSTPRISFANLHVPEPITLAEQPRPNILKRDNPIPFKQRMDLHKKRKSLKPVWSLGVYFVPELYNSEGKYAEKTLFGFDGLVRYTWNNYTTFETGIGIGRVRNENLYTVDYNAFLGTYRDLDSIAFTVDTASQTIVPQYFFNEVDVYDSTTSTYFKRTVNKYTYLQLPIFVGYRHLMGRFSLNMRGGPMLSIMVGSVEPEVYIDDETNRVIQIRDNTPGRITTNWQFLFNAGLSYQLSDKVSISMEPGIRFYLDPIYIGEKNKPWSANLRTGIIYEF